MLHAALDSTVSRLVLCTRSPALLLMDAVLCGWAVHPASWTLQEDRFLAINTSNLLVRDLWRGIALLSSAWLLWAPALLVDLGKCCLHVRSIVRCIRSPVLLLNNVVLRG